MSVTRFSKLKGFPDIIAGRDLAKVFQEGHVYHVEEIMGVIMIKDLGEYAEPDEHSRHDFPSIMMDGTYLLTKLEQERKLKLANQ